MILNLSNYGVDLYFVMNAIEAILEYLITFNTKKVANEKILINLRHGNCRKIEEIIQKYISLWKMY